MENADLFLLIRDERVLLDLTKNRHPTSFAIIPVPPTLSQNGNDTPQMPRSLLRAIGPERSVDHLSKVLAVRQNVCLPDHRAMLA